MTLSLEGAVIMVVSIGMVLLLTGYCTYRVLTLPPVETAKHWQAPLDIDTGDTVNPD